jgi:hypothetical protein
MVLYLNIQFLRSIFPFSLLSLQKFWSHRSDPTSPPTATLRQVAEPPTASDSLDPDLTASSPTATAPTSLWTSDGLLADNLPSDGHRSDKSLNLRRPWSRSGGLLSDNLPYYGLDLSMSVILSELTTSRYLMVDFFWIDLICSCFFFLTLNFLW